MSPQPTCQSFDDAVLTHRRELYAVALRMTRSASDAEDLVQETLIRALGAWDRFEPGTNARAWTRRILINTFISNYRRRRRHRALLHDGRHDAVCAMHGQMNESHDPRPEQFRDQLGDEVVEALETLGPEHREVVELADLRGVQYRDVADRLCVPVGTVMSRLFRARRHLESRLAEFAAAHYGIRRAA